MLDDLRKQLKQAVPEIAESIRQREELAFELRISASKTVQSRREEAELAFGLRSFETVVCGLDYRLKGISTAVVEIWVSTEQAGHHSNRLRGLLLSRCEIDGIDTGPRG